MPHLDANGLRFHVQTLVRPRDPGAPPRPRVVMIHGLIIDNLGSYYYTIANPLALVADVYLYDLRGHGASEAPASGYATGDHVADLVALLDAWGIDEPVHLVSNSFGGTVALELARRFPERVASLVLIETYFAPEGWAPYVAAGLAAFGLDEDYVKGWLDKRSSRRLSLASQSRRLVRETSMQDDLAQEPPLRPEALAAVGCPVLALYGAGSPIIDRGHELERLLPRCELRTVPDCTHSLLTEAAPFLRDQITAWLADQSRVGDRPAGSG